MPLRTRRHAFAVLVAVLSLVTVALFAGTTVLTIGSWLADPGYRETNPVVDLGFFALGGVLVGMGLLAQLGAPERRVAGLLQALVGLLALSGAGLAGGLAAGTGSRWR